MSNRNDHGEYTQTVSDEEVLASFATAARPFQTATDIAERFSLDRSQAYRRLQQLADVGSVQKAKIGGRAVVWWRSDTAGDATTTESHGINPDAKFWQLSGMFPEGGPTDVAANVDKYLYGERDQ